MIGIIFASLPSLFLLANLDLPLMEDGLFWWVPQALIAAERGLSWAPSGELPLACRPDLPLPPQWAGGIPDYGHPPLWTSWLALWLRVLGPSARAVHLACLPAALGVGVGLVALSRRLGGGEAGALPALLCPALLLQVLRPDTDLPLLAFSLGALVAALDRRPLRYALLSSLAVASKEPGVLLVLPALLVALRTPSFRWAALAPPLALLAWALVHRATAGWGLAGSETLAPTLLAWLRNLGSVARIVLLDGGRWAPTLSGLLAPLLAPLLARHLAHHGRASLSRAPAERLLLAWILLQLFFFAGVNFLGGRDHVDALTHVRYLLPALLVALIWSVSRVLRALPPARLALPALALLLLPSLLGARARDPRGPEANLYGWDLARAWREALPHVEALAAPGNRLTDPPPPPILVESYLFTALTRPFAGLVREPVPGLLPHGFDTDPDAVPSGSLVVTASHGEPLSRLGERVLRETHRVRVGEAWVAFLVMEEGRVAGPARPRP
jgi:hypothetical protein